MRVRSIRRLGWPLLWATVLAGITATTVLRSQSTEHSYVPARGFVPDSSTAVAVAEAVLIPIYGRANIERQRPFTASLADGVWSVTGHLAPGMLGGVALVQISKQDGRILRVTHGR